MKVELCPTSWAYFSLAVFLFSLAVVAYLEAELPHRRWAVMVTAPLRLTWQATTRTRRRR